MAYVKKLTDKEFVKKVIDFALKPYGIGYDYIINLPKKPKDQDEIDPNIEYQEEWYLRYTFKNIDEHRAWREYFYETYKDWQPKYRWKKFYVEREFEWFNLQWGLKTDYDYTHQQYQEIMEETYKKVFGSKNKKNKKIKKNE